MQLGTLGIIWAHVMHPAAAVSGFVDPSLCESSARSSAFLSVRLPKTLNPKAVNPKTLNPKTLNPKTLNPIILNPKTVKPKTLNPKTLKP